MDITKRFERIVHIFFLLQSRSIVTNKDLQERFLIGRRTVYRDLKVLAQAGVPIINESGDGFSIMEGFRMQPSRFTQEEVLSLVIAEKLMQKRQTAFVRKNFETALIKIKSSLLVHQKDQILKFEDKLHFNEPIIAPQYLPNVIDMLLAGIMEKHIATISYLKSSDSDIVTREIEPVGLFYENNLWYVLAYCHLRNDYRNFRLDRIKNINLSDKEFLLKHLSITEIRENESRPMAIKIVISVEKQYAHFLYWDRQSFGFIHEEILEEVVIMCFDCRQHPLSFVRWFMRFVDVAQITEPIYLRDEVKTIIVNGIKKLN